MTHWQATALGEILSRCTEIAKIQPDEPYKEITVKLWGKGAVLRGVTTGAELNGSRRFLARKGQLILSRIDARNGAIGLVPESLDGSVVSNDFPLFALNKNLILPGYFEWFSKTKPFVELCQKASEGTTNRVRLQEDRFLNLQILLPPLSEQQRIVSRIEELVAKINEARGLRHQTSETAKAFWERGASTVLNVVGQRHTRERLADLVTIRGGGTPSKVNPYYWDGRIPWITPKDMKVREISDSIDHISEQALRETTAKLIEPGAVLVVVRGMILAHTFPSAVLRVPAVINQDMKALIPINRILPEFLCTFLWATNAAILDLVEKSTHDTRKLETEKLLAIDVPVPPVSDQRQIVEELGAMQTRVEKLQKLQAETSAELGALLPSLLDKAFKGTL